MFDSSLCKRVGKARNEGRFGADDHQADLILDAEFNDGRVVAAIKREAFGNVRDSSVAGRAIQSVEKRAGRQSPGQRVFAPAGADEEDIHACLCCFCDFGVASILAEASLLTT